MNSPCYIQLNDETKSPVVSIIVPAYNSQKTITACVKSLSRQSTDIPYEVIIVDSGNDATISIARAIMPQVKAFHIPMRLNPGEARNLGVSKSKGRILCFIDSDAWAADNWVQMIAAKLDGQKDLIVGGTILNGSPDSSVGRAEYLIEFNEFSQGTNSGTAWFLPTVNIAMHRNLFDRIGGFPKIRAAEDVIFCKNARDCGAKICFSPDIRVYHQNRTELGKYLKNQMVLGTYTAVARRRVPFPDQVGFFTYIMCLPLAPPLKLAKIVSRLYKRNPKNLYLVTRDFHVLMVGLIVYSVGLIFGVIKSTKQK